MLGDDEGAEKNNNVGGNQRRRTIYANYEFKNDADLLLWDLLRLGAAKRQLSFLFNKHLPV